MLPPLLLEQEKDLVARENFQKIQQYLNEEEAIHPNWRFRTFSFTKTGTAMLFKHNCPFTPKDVWQTSLIGSGTVSWVYNKFDGTNVVVTIGGTVSPSNPTTVRVFLGVAD